MSSREMQMPSCEARLIGDGVLDHLEVSYDSVMAVDRLSLDSRRSPRRFGARPLRNLMFWWLVGCIIIGGAMANA
jgi:hypothetical protein